MEQILREEAIELAFRALIGRRLALLCGAGLSMGYPSSVPGAAALAQEIKDKYDAMVPGANLPVGIEEQAEFFFNKGELQTIFIRRLVKPHVFSGLPNAAHFAVADFLLTSAADVAVSANVDGLIEQAGSMLFGEVATGVSVDELAVLQPNDSPLLKIHGCWIRDKDGTLWTEGQLHCDPLETRTNDAAGWARNRLMNRDIVVVGFFTDWDYLNVVLRDALQAVQPARLLIVDPSDPADLKAKAPDLFAVGETATERFCHLQDFGDEFLKALRVRFSKAFIHQALHKGIPAYTAAHGAAPPEPWMSAPQDDPKALWRLRRDLEGCEPNSPATLREAPDEPLVGLTILQFLRAGATWEDAYLSLDGRRVRILRASGQLLHEIKAKFARDSVPILAPDAVIAIGAEDFGLKGHIVRSADEASIARGASPHWHTRATAEVEFGL